MKYIAAEVICPNCKTVSDESFLADLYTEEFVCFTSQWLNCDHCVFVGWVGLRRDWYEIHGNPPRWE